MRKPVSFYHIFMNKFFKKRFDQRIIWRLFLLVLLIAVLFFVYCYYQQQRTLEVETFRLGNKINELKASAYLPVLQNDQASKAYGLLFQNQDEKTSYQVIEYSGSDCFLSENSKVLEEYQLPKQINLFSTSFGKEICFRNYYGINEICTVSYGCDPAANITYQVILLDEKIGKQKIIRIKRDMGVMHLN